MIQMPTDSADNSAYKSHLSYKPSGIAWLGDIPTHWEVIRLKYLAWLELSNVDKHTVEGQRGVLLCNYVDVYKNERITSTLDFMRASATNEQILRLSIRKSDVLFTKDSETPDDIGIPALVVEELSGVVCGYHLALARPVVDSILGEFLFRAIQSSTTKAYYFVESVGMTRYGLGKQSLAATPIPVPPLDEQREITAFLDRETAKIDTLVAKKERLIELLQEKRAAIVNHLVECGLNQDVMRKPSGIPTIGQIPAHWLVQRNKTIFKQVDERSSTGTEELLTVSHITGITPRSEKQVYMFMAESMEGYKICRPNDLVINTMWAWMGALGISRYHGIVSPSYHVYRLRTELCPEYLDYLYRTPAYICEINRFSTGVWRSRLRLYPEAFLEMCTIIPPIEEQRAIVDRINTETRMLSETMTKLQASIDKLREYRMALITAAVTGKIDVREEVAH